MVQYGFNKVYVGETEKKCRVCCKYRFLFFIKKNKLILQKCLQKYDKNQHFYLGILTLYVQNYPEEVKKDFF